MIVTVNTDASFSNRYKIGTYAFWIVFEDTRVKKYGILRDTLESSTEAELASIANALYTLLSLGLENVRKVIINCDCKYAFSSVGLKEPDGTPSRIVAELLRELRNRYRRPGETHLDLHEFRHVKAHTSTTEKRNWVNDWCDRMAKEQMGIALKRISKTTNK